MNKLFLTLSALFLFTTSHAQKPIKPSGRWIEYRREGSNGFCFDADGKRIPYNLVIEFKSKNIVMLKKSDDDPGSPFTYTQQDSVFQIAPDEKLIISNDDNGRLLGYKVPGNDDTYTCYLMSKSAYKKISEAKRSTLSFPTEADMKYRSKIKKEKAKPED